MVEAVKQQQITVKDIVLILPDDPMAKVRHPSINWPVVEKISPQAAEALRTLMCEAGERKPGRLERGKEAKRVFETQAGFTVKDVVKEAREKGREDRPCRQSYWDEYWLELEEF